MNKIKIDSKYSIETDGSGCTLVFEENRRRKKKNSGEEEPFLYRDQWYYLTVTQCLERYLSLSMENASEVKEVLQRVNEVEGTIKSIFTNKKSTSQV